MKKAACYLRVSWNQQAAWFCFCVPWSNEERVETLCPSKLDFVSSQTILFVLTSSETIRNSRNTALLSVFAYISWKRRLKPIFMSTCFFLSRDSITPQKWISSAAWPPASRFIIHSESYRTLQNCTPCRVEDVFMSNTSRWHFKSSNLVVYTFYTLILRCLYLIGDTKCFA